MAIDLGPVGPIEYVKDMGYAPPPPPPLPLSNQPPQKPKLMMRLIREGTIGECPTCGSTLHSKFIFFKTNKCINPTCPNKHPDIKSPKPKPFVASVPVKLSPLVPTIPNKIEGQKIGDIQTDGNGDAWVYTNAGYVKITSDIQNETQKPKPELGDRALEI